MSLNNESRIIAFDPGGTTGVAIYDGGWFNHFHLGPTDHHVQLFDHLRADWDQAVCERFEYRNTSRAGLEIISREYIGVIKLWASWYNRPLVMQNASQAKGFVKDKNLKRLGLHAPGDDHKHAMDAYRHLLYFLVNSSEVDLEIKNSLLQKGWTS